MAREFSTGALYTQVPSSLFVSRFRIHRVSVVGRTLMHAARAHMKRINLRYKQKRMREILSPRIYFSSEEK